MSGLLVAVRQQTVIDGNHPACPSKHYFLKINLYCTKQICAFDANISLMYSLLLYLDDYDEYPYFHILGSILKGAMQAGNRILAFYLFMTSVNGLTVEPVCFLKNKD